MSEFASAVLRHLHRRETPDDRAAAVGIRHRIHADSKVAARVAPVCPGLGVNPEIAPDFRADLVIYRIAGGSIEGVGSPRGGHGTGEEHIMVWKVIGIVVVALIAFWIIGALIKALLPVLVIAAIGTGVYLLYKAMTGSNDKTTLTKP
ncbi:MULTISPECIES: hypothetical protein [unclassified Nocardia]|uniref:hypothetical protein n=1 Tax=unclassified Nocardia TaxID=2637762 RepID=UPI0033B4D917